MNIFFIGTITILLFSGCATKNAFTKLKIDADQEKSIENTRSSKLTSENEVGGIFSAVYLNNIYTALDSRKQLFYISIFRKDTTAPLKLSLNRVKPLEIKELPTSSKYVRLLKKNNQWTKNYLVSFEVSTTTTDLNLSIDSGRFSSGSLRYLKDLQ